MTNNFISNETPIVGKLSIISMKGCEGITAKIDEYLRAFRGYEDTETYVTHVTCPRFGTGEGKCVIDETVRGHDVYIICDVFNYGVTYKMYGVENHMSPDDHYQDLKRVIAAMGGKAVRAGKRADCRPAGRRLLSGLSALRYSPGRSDPQQHRGHPP